MPEYLTQKEAFGKCKREGKIIITEQVGEEKIKATLAISEGDVESANILKKNLTKSSNQWNSIYKLYYDALHELAESFLQFEKVRTKRNGINYYGTPVDSTDWKEVELQFSLYIKKLREEIKKRLKA